MLIDNINIAQFSAKQWNVKVGHSEIENASEWVPGRLVPVFFRSRSGFKEIEITLLVKGKNREAIISNRGAVLSLLMETRTLTLDGFTHKFRVILKKSSATESSISRFHKLVLTFYGYEFGEEVIEMFESTANIQIQNTGTVYTPLYLEVTPLTAMEELTIAGVCKDQSQVKDEVVILKNLSAQKSIVFDGEIGLLTEDGVIKQDADFWSLPCLAPGVNQIDFSSGQVNVTLKWRPRYM